MKPCMLHVKLICFLLAGVNLAACSTGGSDDDRFVYSGFTGRNLTLDGAAVITGSGLLELTNGTLRSKAHAIHPVKFQFRSPSTAAARSFSASFVFGIFCPDADACGHGIVFFVAPSDHNFAAAFPSQYIGLVNNISNGDAANHIFGVELDTAQNNEFHDIDGNHVGVDINSLKSIESRSAGYYYDGGGGDRIGFRNLTLASHEAMQVWVDYNGTSKQINVAMAPLRTAKPSMPLLSCTYDLSTVLLTDKPYIYGRLLVGHRIIRLETLHSGSDNQYQTLDWGQRFRIIKGIASALLYLHEEWEKVIIHRDIKTSNVLLDSEMNGRLGDFGLARLYDRGEDDPQTTHVVGSGTIGYLAPELVAAARPPLRLTFSLLAFSFLRLLVGGGLSRFTQQAPPPWQGDQDQRNPVLVDWVLEHWHEGSVADTVDAKLHGNYNLDEVCLVLKLGLLCSHPLSGARPTIRQVVRYLNGDAAMPELTPTHQCFETLTLMQSQRFDSYVMSYPSSTTSTNTMSNLSAQR
ncbi:hypothetical protein GUJ93_ZPchr0005g16102 [Zizania palustris]|uniref:non-specific serine/threonine protein kinase n=1 Tax=Zizania palustris TaxID=103762 RepID=A0A8J5W0D6_ZIZPA|nr:hypothetical protein GUJ93_ZPchr0005g16102 [Zizania palustris]